MRLQSLDCGGRARKMEQPTQVNNLSGRTNVSGASLLDERGCLFRVVEADSGEEMRRSRECRSSSVECKVGGRWRKGRGEERMEVSKYGAVEYYSMRNTGKIWLFIGRTDLVLPSKPSSTTVPLASSPSRYVICSSRRCTTIHQVAREECEEGSPSTCIFVVIIRLKRTLSLLQ